MRSQAASCKHAASNDIPYVLLLRALESTNFVILKDAAARHMTSMVSYLKQKSSNSDDIASVGRGVEVAVAHGVWEGQGAGVSLSCSCSVRGSSHAARRYRRSCLRCSEQERCKGLAGADLASLSWLWLGTPMLASPHCCKP